MDEIGFIYTIYKISNTLFQLQWFCDVVVIIVDFDSSNLPFTPVRIRARPVFVFKTYASVPFSLTATDCLFLDVAIPNTQHFHRRVSAANIIKLGITSPTSLDLYIYILIPPSSTNNSHPLFSLYLPCPVLSLLSLYGYVTKL